MLRQLLGLQLLRQQLELQQLLGLHLLWNQLRRRPLQRVLLRQLLGWQLLCQLLRQLLWHLWHLPQPLRLGARQLHRRARALLKERRFAAKLQERGRHKPLRRLISAWRPPAQQRAAVGAPEAREVRVPRLRCAEVVRRARRVQPQRPC